VTAEKTKAVAWLRGLDLWRLGKAVEVEWKDPAQERRRPSLRDWTWSGPLAPREGSRSRTEISSTRAVTTKISRQDMDVGCYEDSKAVKGSVGDLEPRLEPQRTSRELALENIGIGQGVRHSSNEDPEHSLGIEVDGGEFPGP
jgi:hypothetical protein